MPTPLSRVNIADDYPLSVKDVVPDVGNILSGSTSTDNGTLITIPAGRIWRGQVSLAATVRIASNTAASLATPRVTVVGAGATPANGTALAGLAIGAPQTLLGALAGTVDSSAMRVDIVVAAASGQSADLRLTLNGSSNAFAVACGILV